jgi:hypothetical protein
MRPRYQWQKLPAAKYRAMRPREFDAEHALRRIEIDLLRRQTYAAYLNISSAILFSFAIIVLTYRQYLIAESTAAIERAKVRPHFSIRQENEHDELGFLPRRFWVESDAGVADASEAQAMSMMEIRYVSRDLPLLGTCRVAFINFYGWTNDALSFELNEAAARLMALSRQPDRISQSWIRIRPLWMVVNVTFTDIFDLPGEQDLLLAAGRPRSLKPDELAGRARAGITLHLQLEGNGRVVLHPVGPEPVARECRDALQVMSRIPWLRLARAGELPQDTDLPFVTSADAP